jgi:hypothetical protein
MSLRRRAQEPRFSRRMVSSPHTADGAADACAVVFKQNSRGTSPMPIRLLAFALLAGACVAEAAPPKKAPTQDAASAQQAPESIDVDALARSKDAGGSTPTDADAPPAQTPAPAEVEPQTPPTDAPPVEAPPADAAPSEAPPPASVEAAPPADAGAAPSEAAANAEPIAPEAAVAAPNADDAKSATSEKISLAASCQARATSLLDSAEKADFNGASSAFDAKMRTSLPPPKFRQAWDQLSQFGKLVARGQSHLSSGDGYTLVMIPLIFEKANLVAQIACGTDGRIAGFYVKPVPTQAPQPAPNS